MNSPNPLKLKNPKNWFAAGEEMQKAMDLLTAYSGEVGH
jgi:hypothetical protein